MKDFPRAKEGREHTFPPYYPLFLHVRGGGGAGVMGNVIMIIVFVNFLHFLAYKPTPLLRVSAPAGKIIHKALQQDCKIFFGIFKNVKNFSFFYKVTKRIGVSTSSSTF